MNKIPANKTNIAMADALAALEIVSFSSYIRSIVCSCFDFKPSVRLDESDLIEIVIAIVLIIQKSNMRARERSFSIILDQLIYYSVEVKFEL